MAVKDPRRRNSLPNILAALGQDKPKESVKGASVVMARIQKEEMQRAGAADIPWHKLTSQTAKDEHGRRMSASMQAVHRRNSYGAIPLGEVKIRAVRNPLELPTNVSGNHVARASIHS